MLLVVPYPDQKNCAKPEFAKRFEKRIIAKTCSTQFPTGTRENVKPLGDMGSKTVERNFRGTLRFDDGVHNVKTKTGRS